MKRSLCLIAAICFTYLVNAQTLKKYPIDKSGCSVYLFCDPGEFRHQLSEDTSEVYTAECMSEDISYGVICVKFASPINDLQEAVGILTTYLDYLKKSVFNIASSAGYGKGHRLKGREDIHGIIDYWKDGDKNEYKIKGWTNGKFLSVLYVMSKKEVPETKANVFLDGIVFPGM